MDNVSLLAARKTEWSLTEKAFDGLLASLADDRADAGERYEQVRRKLIEFFEARGSESPTDHTDQTINRVARRIEEGEVLESIERYSHGVARLLWMEILRARQKQPVALDLVNVPTISAGDGSEEVARLDQERRLECFESCLAKLPNGNRVLVIEYYREDTRLKIEQRKDQAERLSLSLNALRLRACRIRSELAECINSCLGHQVETRNHISVTG
jgi:DNA-directed RNA polymerase specialized sigma24 family protein